MHLQHIHTQNAQSAHLIIEFTNLKLQRPAMRLQFSDGVISFHNGIEGLGDSVIKSLYLFRN